jgi:hypothetical protein
MIKKNNKQKAGLKEIDKISRLLSWLKKEKKKEITSLRNEQAMWAQHAVINRVSDACEQYQTHGFHTSEKWPNASKSINYPHVPNIK